MNNLVKIANKKFEDALSINFINENTNGTREHFFKKLLRMIQPLVLKHFVEIIILAFLGNNTKVFLPS